jgi:hypothetical protein
VPGRPRLPKPKLPGRKSSGTGKPTGLWFRVSTRFTAIGYWIREKAQTLDRRLTGVTEWLEQAGAFVAGLWTGRSREAKTRILAVSGVVLLYVLLKFTPAPLVPCQVSAVKECAPDDGTVALAPGNALLYAHVTLDEDSDQFEQAEDLADRLPQLGGLLQELTAGLPAPAGAAIDVNADVLPWASDDLALTSVPGPKRTSASAFLVGVGDRDEAEAFLDAAAPAGEPKESDVSGETLRTWPAGFAAAFVGDTLVFGDGAAVTQVLAAGAGEADSIADLGDDPRDRLPDARFAEVYLSRAGVQRFLAAQAGASGASQLETFVNYGATSGMAVAARTREDGVEFDVVSDLDPELVKRSPTFFAELPRFEPHLTDEVGSRAIGYLAIGEVGPTLNALLESAGQEAQGLAGSLRGLAQRLEQEAGVDPLKDLLPALGGQAALTVEPTDGVPFASLIVDDVDTGRAEEAVASLQGPLLRSLQAPGAPQIPSFTDTEVDGVTVHSVQVTPAINLSYAIFDDKLVISTDPAGVAQVRSDASKLVNSESYVEASDDLPDEVSALVFLNLDELLAQIRRTDLVEDPFFASLSINLENVNATALAVRGSDEEINSELFVAIPED